MGWALRSNVLGALGPWLSSISLNVRFPTLKRTSQLDFNIDIKIVKLAANFGIPNNLRNLFVLFEPVSMR